MFVYIWVLFALSAIHRSIVLAEEHLDYVMLIGEDLNLGSELRDKSLLYSILYKSLVFSVFLIGFHVLEEVLVGVFTGRTISQSIPAIGGASLQGLLSHGAVMFVAMIPFFAFREIGRVIGRRELRSLLLSRGTRVCTLQSRPRE
jgi:hypothetical protein